MLLWEGEVKFREQSKALLMNILYRAVLVSDLPITSQGPLELQQVKCVLQQETWTSSGLESRAPGKLFK